MKSNKTATIKLVLIIIASVLALTLIPTGIYCAVEKQNPIEMISSMKTTSEDMLIGKWQDENGTTAYEFFDDGTYDSYISTFTYSGKYQAKGDEIKLVNPDVAGVVIYKYKVSKNELTLTLYQEQGLDADGDYTTVYNRVNRIDTKSPKEIFNTFTDELKEEAAKQKDK